MSAGGPERPNNLQRLARLTEGYRQKETPARADQHAFEEAGFVDIKTGALGRALDLTALQVPPIVELDDTEERLLWAYARDGEKPTRHDRYPDEMMLNGFIALAAEPASRIREFARRWGPLDICKHNLPASHNRHWSVYWPEPTGCAARSVPEAPEWRWEPIERWRHYSEQARSMLHVAKRIQDGAPVSAEEWFAIGFPMPDVFPATEDLHRANSATGFAPRALALLVTEWLNYGGVQPVLQWGAQADGPHDVSRPHLKLAPHGLFGVLALQLATALARVERIAFCSSCGKPYFATKKPSQGRRNFCKGCGSRAAWRLAKRDERSDRSKRRDTSEQGGQNAVAKR